ncbi:MAG: hypothetical protein M1346_01210 [Gammaproteobacteria bacterium]|nr:hypothetical protein [Gammaproteobacteria bacterium]
MNDYKQRIQFFSLDLSREYQQLHGGHVLLRDTGSVFWYSWHYTPSEIFADFRGDGVLNPEPCDAPCEA